jgi:hypothetical protein
MFTTPWEASSAMMNPILAAGALSASISRAMFSAETADDIEKSPHPFFSCHAPFLPLFKTRFSEMRRA